jgi:transcriptional repressor NrdR
VNCPQCQHEDSKVLETRAAPDSTRRRRQCLACGHRFTTQERIEQRLPLVVKKAGEREPFDRDKLVAGVRIACRKRPVSAEAIDAVVDRVCARLSMGGAEVSTTDIGDAVLSELRGVDLVAYVRFASVYNAVQTPADFLRILDPWLDAPPEPA